MKNTGNGKDLNRRSYLQPSSDHIDDSHRWSFIQPGLDYCFLCGRYNVPLELHEVFHGTANRQKSKDHGFVVALCPKCHRFVHNHRKTDAKLQELVQKMWEMKGNSREDFMKIFGKNYVRDEECLKET